MTNDYRSRQQRFGSFLLMNPSLLATLLCLLSVLSHASVIRGASRTLQEGASTPPPVGAVYVCKADTRQCQFVPPGTPDAWSFDDCQKTCKADAGTSPPPPPPGSSPPPPPPGSSPPPPPSGPAPSSPSSEVPTTVAPSSGSGNGTDSNDTAIPTFEQPINQSAASGEGSTSSETQQQQQQAEIPSQPSGGGFGAIAIASVVTGCVVAVALVIAFFVARKKMSQRNHRKSGSRSTDSTNPPSRSELYDRGPDLDSLLVKTIHRHNNPSITTSPAALSAIASVSGASMDALSGATPTSGKSPILRGNLSSASPVAVGMDKAERVGTGTIYTLSQVIDMPERKKKSRGESGTMFNLSTVEEGSPNKSSYVQKRGGSEIELVQHGYSPVSQYYNGLGTPPRRYTNPRGEEMVSQSPMPDLLGFKTARYLLQESPRDNSIFGAKPLHSSKIDQSNNNNNDDLNHDRQNTSLSYLANLAKNEESRGAMPATAVDDVGDESGAKSYANNSYYGDVSNGESGAGDSAIALSGADAGVTGNSGARSIVRTAAGNAKRLKNIVSSVSHMISGLNTIKNYSFSNNNSTSNQSSSRRKQGLSIDDDEASGEVELYKTFANAQTPREATPPSSAAPHNSAAEKQKSTNKVADGSPERTATKVPLTESMTQQEQSTFPDRVTHWVDLDEMTPSEMSDASSVHSFSSDKDLYHT